ncbi:hypothetical protein TD95_003324 [Thielaviopsis punctulata]|uniref:Methyltransferase type 11 domain-containing protein n=1 Tax=Thielaviopsis punctulata TaxID=72032 RepID=A0A0F4ZE91_9PEZI|nr:hypothetical protein TD95_003324 [Thielaviopsis punctulata]
MPPPSAHSNATSTARALRAPRIYAYSSASASEDEPSAATTTATATTTTTPTSSSSSSATTTPASSSASSKSKIRPRRDASEPVAVRKPLATSTNSSNGVGPRLPSTLARRRSALAQDVPHINTRVSPVPAPRRPSHSPHNSNASISTIPRPTSPHIYPELDRWPRHTRHASAASPSNDPDVPFRLTTDLPPPPTPGLLSGTSSQVSASPSTRFSESPGPWPWSAGSMNNMLASPYSRDTTPTSLVSQSPSSVGVVRFATTARKASLKPRPKLSIPCPSPPPRKSSYKFIRPRDREPVTSPTSPPVSMVTRPGRSSAEARRSISAPIRPAATTTPTTATPNSPTPNSATATPNPTTATTNTTSVITSNASNGLTAYSAAPRRPSRDGIPDITGIHEPPRVIHSNLTSSHMRSGSDSAAAVAGLGMTSTPERLRKPKPATSPKTAAPAPRPIPCEPTPPKRLRTPSPVVATSSRFAFFGKKKTTDAPAPAPREKLLHRKGPAAGTGHEGYGRLGAVRRRSGSLTNIFRGPSSSQESLPVDTFLLDRMSPVVISGGEVVKNHNDALSQNSSSTSLAVEFNVFQPSFSTPAIRPSAIPHSGRRPSDSSDSEVMAAQSALAFRKQQRQKACDSRRISPKPPTSPLLDSVESNIDAVFSDESSAMDAGSTATAVSSASSASATCAPAATPAPAASASTLTTALVPATSAEPKHNTHGLKAGPKKLTKRPRSPRRWNPFSSRTNAAKKAQPTSPVPAAVEVVPARKVAYYMLDSTESDGPADVPEPLNVHAVRDVLRGADVQLPDTVDATPAPDPAILEPPVPPFGSWSSNSSPVLPQPSTMDSLAPTPGSRLRQVGRIPKVISSRNATDSERRPEPVPVLPLGIPPSFSRPFNRASFHAAMKTHRSSYIPTPAVANSIAALTQSPPLGTPDLVTDSTSCTTLNGSPVREQTVEVRGQPEFIRFSPRKSSSTSATTESWLYSFVSDIVAVQPAPDAPLGEDEVWDEYDDFLCPAAYTPAEFPAGGLPIELFDDEEIAPLSATSSKGSPFHLEAYRTELPSAARLTQTSSTSSTDMTERLRTIFAPKPPPTAQSSYSPVTAQLPPAALKPASPPPTTPLPSPNARFSVTTASSCRTSDSSGSDSPLAQVNLRVGSMTVSKWLTFGHVMFSPARDQLLTQPPSSLSAMLSPSRSTPASMPSASSAHSSPSVLVLDGLGNDDWSFYAAETYPGASFFNLSPRAPIPADRRASTGFPLSPANHHQIQYTSLQHKLPFGADTFVAAIVRFPSAAPEAHLRNLVSEVRRVLVPGGYIELSILDMDLNNMGNRGRRAVRRLKEQLREKNPETELGSTADTLLRLLNSRSFSEIKFCRVGIPVGEAKRGKRDTRSLAEMMSDEGPGADESITKMVSRVGRWWYARCYEGAGSGGGGEESMWRDGALLAECAEWGTSLKLMVCHARKPVDGLSRVASI